MLHWLLSPSKQTGHKFCSHGRRLTVTVLSSQCTKKNFATETVWTTLLRTPTSSQSECTGCCQQDHAGSETLHQQNPPVLNRRCWLTQVDLYTHTHTFNGPLSGTTRVSQYQKGKTNLNFTGARDSEWQWHQLDHMQVCTLLQTVNHASTPRLLFFTCRMHFLLPNQQLQSTEGRLYSIPV